MPTELLLVYCTCPDLNSAESISRQLIEQGAAACVNRLPGVFSTYMWQGNPETSEEILLLIKSCSERYPEVEKIIVSLHPYELPEIIAVSVDRGLPDYLHWVKQCTENQT
ncbi:MAG: divalent-cation tolerance protein CutA [Chromatiaceae bacterium]|nr:divalent-cation tolerance protein CutA [Gammaproteobacteria bacterium]MCP5427014.1 divalent-cation tolerance protein CutA [Chromatiaceae bacterium]MCB1861638.1 divalent-cation tolerance protein CutA [Gammaproteobacteria bacterium]MCB1879819.1 divalent-cation tolerance protein CutA [Gammaproteobacteria bacterium]MCB1902975.1 divalent-cation tolerance protein CutA [Gammaproteobacteria bacterium]